MLKNSTKLNFEVNTLKLVNKFIKSAVETYKPNVYNRPKIPY